MYPQKPSLKEAFLFWLKLGFISFGGPAGQIAIMHQYLVEKKKWISETKFLHALNYCMLLPGPEAQQMATYSGWLLHGVKGGLIAGILFVLPSVFILLGLSVLYVSFGSLPFVFAIFSGLKPAVIGIIVVALFKIGKRSLVTSIHILISVLSFVSILFFNFPFPLIILSAIILGIILQKFAQGILDPKKGNENKSTEESVFYINSNSIIPHTIFSWNRIVKQFIIAVLLWLSPFILFNSLLTDSSFWNTLSLFFTKAALVTFGGAYAVLPYVAQVSVDKFHWLTHLQMIDGLALGESTPGPLIMVLSFVGFMGAYNHYGQSIVFGTMGLLTTVWFTFLPCFLFIFIGAPIVERTQNDLKIKIVLSFVSAAVVGVIFNLALYLFRSVVFPTSVSIETINVFNLVWIIISVIVLHYFKLNMILWIILSALAGLGYYMLFP